ncbi:MAG: hypothetical protein E6K80_11100 [Candidatus Eisenbacteria bacterium]|uniref:Uncharacterized protein n=1 Tax=Eiseniibacteriota bacterium TaxID=2212470 RepID=A0A538U173_UNCEI|nr:MAG: hypothetical protein E6K80_11100 [Candidatus Eisenbacteria bacterium]
MPAEPEATPPPSAATVPDPTRRPPTWVWVALVALAALAAFYRSDDNDYWFHLAAGRSILQHGLPTHETWCLAARGEAPWLSEWLFHVALYQVHRVAGDWGVTLWRMGWTALAMALAIRILFLLDAASWSAALLAPLLLAVARDRFQPRPEQIFVVALLFAIFLFESARRGRDRTAGLIPAQALWANLQGSWVFGPGVAWVYAATAWLDRRASREPPAGEPVPAAKPPRAWGRAARWAGLGVALWLVSAVVPRPLETLARPFRFLVDVGVDPLTGSVEELRRWSWISDRSQPFTALLVVWLVALLVGGRRIVRTSPALLLLGIGGMALGFLGVRFRGLGAWMSFAPLAVALVPRGAPLARRALLAPALASGVLGGAWLVTAPQFTLGAHPQLYSVPVRAAALADSLHLHGPMFNTFHYGGYLLWARGEQDPPLVDGRGRGSLAFRSLYARSFNDPVALDSLLEQWDFNYLLIEPPQSIEDRLAINIARRLEWGLIFYDDAGLLYVRWNRYPAIGQTRAYRYFTPDYLAMTNLSEQSAKDPGLRQRLIAELLRARRESPFHGRASLWLGLLALDHQDPKSAVPYLDEAYRIAPAMPGLALRQGMAHEMIGDRRGALAAYRRALHEDEDRTIAQASIQALRSLR